MKQFTFLVLAGALGALIAHAQSNKDGHDSAWLTPLVGTWDGEPGGTTTVRAQGQHWVVAESTSDRGRLSLGYDAQAKAFRGTRVDPGSGQLWVYRGELNAARDTLTLESVDAGAARSREVIRVSGNDAFTVTRSARADDGSWKETGRATYSRTASPLAVRYLEIVSSDAEATCAALEKIHGVSFGKPVAVFGNARIAILKGGGRLGVRAPMRGNEPPVVRPYLLVDDLAASVKAAQAAGAQFAMLPTKIPGHGEFAIYIQGGIQYGLWQR